MGNRVLSRAPSPALLRLLSLREGAGRPVLLSGAEPHVSGRGPRGENGRLPPGGGLGALAVPVGEPRPCTEPGRRRWPQRKAAGVREGPPRRAGGGAGLPGSRGFSSPSGSSVPGSRRAPRASRRAWRCPACGMERGAVPDPGFLGRHRARVQLYKNCSPNCEFDV